MIWRRLRFAMAAIMLAGPAAALASQPPEAPPPAVAMQFAPPLDRPLAYHVIIRRLARDGSLAGFTLDYELQWRRAGRGYALRATLRRIASDAPPAVMRVMTGLVEPLLDQPADYLVAADGRNLTLDKADDFWARIGPAATAVGQSAKGAEAAAMTKLLLSLPPVERENLLSAHIRSLIAAAQPEIPRRASTISGHRTVLTQEGDRLVISDDNRNAAVPGSAAPLTTMSRWTIDGPTGLVVQSSVQSWVMPGDGGEKSLVEERRHELILATP